MWPHVWPNKDGVIMALVLIESPNKIKKLRQILGSNYTIMATVGHILDLSKKNMGFDPDTFKETFRINPDKKDVVSSIKKEAKNHDIIYIATDPDREGEAIAHHIAKYLPKNGVTIYRALFNSITKDAVNKAIKSPSKLNNDLYDAQRARRITDRIVGFKVSPVMWSKGLRGTSAGRVQSVALKYLAEKEKDIRAFVKKEYWKIKVHTDIDFEAEFFSLDDKTFVPSNKTEASSIVNDMRKDEKDLVVSDYSQKSRVRKPYPPFITSSMQQAASNRFGWSAKKTMSVAQALFSYGLITYHRTDSVRVDSDKIDDIRDRIELKYGKKYLSTSIISYKDKNTSQGAHEAVRPTFDAANGALKKDETKLLGLVTSRFTASQMSNAKFDQASIKLEYVGAKKYGFKAAGSVLKFDGFLKEYGSDKGDIIIPALSVGDSIKWSSVVPSQHFTQPPPRYSDASLIKKMESDGVGRPSTYASIIDTLLNRKYVDRAGKSFECTETGIMVSDYLSEHFPRIVDVGFTASMESSLDDISDGSSGMTDFLRTFFDSMISDIDVAMKSGLPKSFSVSVECPKCSSDMIKKISNHGPFLGCSGWPECDGVSPINPEDRVPEAVDTGIKCPDCSGVLVRRGGKNGEFYGCKSYPTCKFTAGIAEDGALVVRKKSVAKDTGHKCPKCKKGTMLERNGRYGKFYGCSSYPKCKTILKSIK